MAYGKGDALVIEGGPELERLLKSLPGKVSRKYAGKAIRAGMKIIKPAISSRIPVRTGLLKKSLVIRVARRRKGRVLLMFSFAKEYAKRNKFYAPFVEWGHKIGKRPPGMKARRADARALAAMHDTRGEVQGRHFAREGFDATADRAGKVICETLKELIEASPKDKSPV